MIAKIFVSLSPTCETQLAFAWPSGRLESEPDFSLRMSLPLCHSTFQIAK